MTTRLLLVGLLSPFATLGLGAPAVADDRNTSFGTSGACTEVAAAIPVDVSVARHHVPTGFTPKQTGGKAVLGVFEGRCAMRVDFGAPRELVIGGAFVQTDPAASPAGCESYDFFWTSNRRDDYLRAYQQLGWASPLDTDGRFTVSGQGASTLVTAHNQNAVANFDMALAGTAAPPVLPAVPFTSVHCHLGPRGLVKGTYDHEFSAFTGVAGTLEVEPGSLLWELVGERQVVEALALLAEFDFGATTALVEPGP